MLFNLLLIKTSNQSEQTTSLGREFQSLIESGKKLDNI